MTKLEKLNSKDLERYLSPEALKELTQISNDPEWLVGLVEAYENQTRTQIAHLAVALEEGRSDACLEMTHVLKSSSLQMGARAVGRGFEEIEGLVVGGDYAAAREKHAALHLDFEQSLIALKAFFGQGAPS